MQLFDQGKRVLSCGAVEASLVLARDIAAAALESEQPVCYTQSDDFLFCGLVRRNGGAEYLLLGPVSAFAFNRRQGRRQGQKLLARLDIPESRLYDLPGWFKTLPVCDPPRFRELLLFLDYILNGETGRQAVYVPCRKTMKQAIPAEANLSFIEHVSDLLEKELLSAVEHGKPGDIMALFDRLESSGGAVPPVASNPDRAFRNIFISAAGIISRAALRGGLDYDTVIELSTYYIERIEQLEGNSAISMFLRQMFLDFAQRTARIRGLSAASALTRRINKIIMAHIYEKLTAAGIAKILGMNCSYLCRHFKRETGKTISAYVNEIKTDEAKRLLESTELSIVDISTQLGYSSQNYFQTIFKGIAGMTPGV
ncbi:MAG: AraC family transcriptional regulator, partial [Treponema sp.]|nr:AraC family transcriptional regulator [Treponema sp.]